MSAPPARLAGALGCDRFSGRAEPSSSASVSPHRQERNLIRQLQQLTGKTVTLTPDLSPRPHSRS
jgi:hypothetical protein